MRAAVFKKHVFTVSSSFLVVWIVDVINPVVELSMVVLAESDPLVTFILIADR